MSSRTADLASSLRTCPLCSSDAVMASRIADAGPPGLRCIVRCGGCETWRGATLPAAQGFDLEFWLRRKERKAKRRLARELRRLERGRRHLIGGPLTVFAAGTQGPLVT